MSEHDDDPIMQWSVEHDEPHCFACGREILPNSKVLLARPSKENVIVWWHYGCRPKDDE